MSNNYLFNFQPVNPPATLTSCWVSLLGLWCLDVWPPSPVLGSCHSHHSCEPSSKWHLFPPSLAYGGATSVLLVFLVSPRPPHFLEHWWPIHSLGYGAGGVQYSVRFSGLMCYSLSLMPISLGHFCLLLPHATACPLSLGCCSFCDPWRQPGVSSWLS
jgi:hypothetical protein